MWMSHDSVSKHVTCMDMHMVCMYVCPSLDCGGCLSLSDVVIACIGLQAVAKKVGIIKGLFIACRHSEARYLIR